MSRPFRLASLLHLRGMAEDRAAAELAAASRLRAAADARRHDTEVMLGSASLPGHSDELHFHAAAASRAALGSLLTERRSEVQTADAEVAVASIAWTAARVQTKALERLQERHDAQVRAEDERAEQMVLDEVGARMLAARADARQAPGEAAVESTETVRS
ncbi:MAG TPA: flagellar export protein FliJ [Cellulomonas sp.]